MEKNEQTKEEYTFSMRFKPYMWDVLSNKSLMSGLDRASYIKLLISKVDVEAVVGGRLLRHQKEVRKMFKKELRGLEVAESHALKALSREYNSILAVNELWLYNPGWTRKLILQWCDKYEVKIEDFEFTKPIAQVIIKAYFEIEDIVERKQGFTRGRYQLRPDYSLRDVQRMEKKLLQQDAKKFDALFKRLNLKFNKEDKQALLSFKEEVNEPNENNIQPTVAQSEEVIPTAGD